MAEGVKLLDIGEVGSRVTDVIGANRQAVLIYLAIFIPLTVLADFADSSLGLVSASRTSDMQWNNNNGAIGLIAMLASVYGQLWLFGRFAGAGQGQFPTFGRYLPFIGMAILTWLGVAFATVFLIVPGLFLASRWLMSPAIYVHEGLGAIESIGESWRRTSGNTGRVMVVVLILVLALIVIGVVLGGVLSIFGEASSQLLMNGIVGEVATIIIVSTSVAVYSLLNTRVEDLGEVFE